MNKSFIFWFIWICFIAYAFTLAPPQQANTFSVITQLSTGQWDDINPAIVALFNLMGIWPVIYGAMLFADGHEQRVPAWPFAMVSFGVGAFALLPYFALRQPNPVFSGSQSKVLQFFDSRWLGVAIALPTLFFLAYGIIGGDWGDFVNQWQQSRFIHVMSLDFCLLCGLVSSLLGDDMARRGLSDRRIYWAVVLIPLMGVVTYLCLRPSLFQPGDRVRAYSP